MSWNSWEYTTIVWHNCVWHSIICKELFLQQWRFIREEWGSKPFWIIIRSSLKSTTLEKQCRYIARVSWSLPRWILVSMTGSLTNAALSTFSNSLSIMTTAGSFYPKCLSARCLRLIHVRLSLHPTSAIISFPQKKYCIRFLLMHLDHFKQFLIWLFLPHPRPHMSTSIGNYTSLQYIEHEVDILKYLLSWRHGRWAGSRADVLPPLVTLKSWLQSVVGNNRSRSAIALYSTFPIL